MSYRGLLKQSRVQKVQRVQRVQRVVVSPLRAMNIKSVLRAFPPDTVILSGSEESWYMPHMRQMAVNTGRRRVRLVLQVV